ncbi:hypothetical protein L3V16_20955 [Brucella ciceri]|uniref:hypothetical protein n=1 Tax=Brucella ciceri TaxID=391287 RepID=UPI000DE4EB3D|nr:hypothetical protein [Brucella ciceri]MCH6206296.1 hypothetical protein [Brucella ciceri]
MTDIKMTEYAENQMAVGASKVGTIGKSLVACMQAEVLRSNPNFKTALIDGDAHDENCNQTFRKVFGQRENGELNGTLLPADDNDYFTGCRTINLRKANARSGDEIFGAVEQGANRIYVDGAGGSEANFGKLIIEENGDPEFFVNTLKDLGYDLTLVIPILGSSKGRAADASDSLRFYFDTYGRFDNVHFHVFLSQWGSDKVDNDADPDFRYWFNSKLRPEMLETERLHETRLMTLAPDVFRVISDFSTFEVGAPLSNLVDPAFAQQNGISLRHRIALKKARDFFLAQCAADPFLKNFLGIA